MRGTDGSFAEIHESEGQGSGPILGATNHRTFRNDPFVAVTMRNIITVATPSTFYAFAVIMQDMGRKLKKVLRVLLSREHLHNSVNFGISLSSHEALDDGN